MTYLVFKMSKVSLCKGAAPEWISRTLLTSNLMSTLHKATSIGGTTVSWVIWNIRIFMTHYYFITYFTSRRTFVLTTLINIILLYTLKMQKCYQCLQVLNVINVQIQTMRELNVQVLQPKSQPGMDVQ